jgi:hypothetical protein
MEDLAIQLVSSLLWTAATVYGSYRLFRFLRSARSRMRGESDRAAEVLANAQRGTGGLQVRKTHDPGLETIPKYPKAVPLDSKFEYEVEVSGGRYVYQGFWTADPLATVVAFYQRGFSNWERDPEFMVGRGYRCREQKPGRVRTVEIRSESSRTIINYSVLYSENVGRTERSARPH